MKGTAYCTVQLPRYFDFDPLLKSVTQAVGNHTSCDLYKHKTIRNLDDVNYRLISNKDGKYAWRQLELIHPVLYVLLVNCITEDSSWETIRQRFTEFHKVAFRIRCMSLPLAPKEDEKVLARQVRKWWHEIEQRSIEYALDYEYLIHTDVVDCYPSIYTHSICWALHGKEECKEKKGDNKLIGNVIDNFIQDMRHGQTNGIPEGSVLMDFIAEMVLGYADFLLAKKLKKESVDYKILRYRDDYRIFAKDPLGGDKIMKVLSEVMISLGMKLHPLKTKASDQVICSSIKRDKLSWNFRKQREEDPQTQREEDPQTQREEDPRTQREEDPQTQREEDPQTQREEHLQKHLLIIHDHSMIHPNSGSLVRALTEFRDRLDTVPANTSKYYRGLPLISIAVDIAYRNPKTYPQVSSIISKCLEYLDTQNRRKDVLKRIRKKFAKVPNVGYMELWLQRICLRDDPVDFEEPLCKLVSETENEIWNSSWVTDEKFMKNAVVADSIVDRDDIQELSPVIDREEIELFPLGYQ